MQHSNNQKAETLVFLFPIALFAILLTIKVMSPDTYWFLVREDSALEYTQFFFYLIASVFSIFVAKKFFNKKLAFHGALYSLLAIGLLFVSLEEISWAQRVFDIDNPDFFARRNVQNEISLHNLDIMQPRLRDIYILTGAFGAFSWLLVTRFWSESKKTCRHIVNFAIPRWYLSSYFFFCFFIYFFLHWICRFGVAAGIEKLRVGGFFSWRDEEYAELFLSLGFFSFAVDNHIKSRSCLPE